MAKNTARRRKAFLAIRDDSCAAKAAFRVRRGDETRRVGGDADATPGVAEASRGHDNGKSPSGDPSPRRISGSRRRRFNTVGKAGFKGEDMRLCPFMGADAKYDACAGTPGGSVPLPLGVRPLYPRG